MALRKIAVWAALTVFLVFISTVEAVTEGVTISGTEFTMTCQGAEEWYVNNKPIDKSKVKDTLTLKYDNDKKGPHYCQYGSPETKKYYFYVRAKVCQNCFELDPIVFALAIVLDVIVTAVVMMIIYKLGKRRSSGGPSNAPRASGRSVPPVPSSAGSSAYETLNVHTRGQETYSKLNRMG